MKYYIDSITTKMNEAVILGWAVSENPDIPVDIYIEGGCKERIKISRTNMGRFDVNQECFHGKSNLELGFCISFCLERDKKYYIVFEADDKRKRKRLNIKIAAQRGTSIYAKVIKGFRKVTDAYNRYGLKAFVRIAWGKVKRNGNEYNKWRCQVKKSIKTTDYKVEQELIECIKFSIVVPLYRTQDVFLKEMIESVQRQTYAKWELCLSDGSGRKEDNDRLSEEVYRFGNGDSRIKYQCLEGEKGIADNTNAALRMATGDYIVFLDHDDMLAEEALLECAIEITKSAKSGRKLQLIYSDEDKVMKKRGKDFYFDPHFKPDFNPELLCSMNYISHLLVVEKELLYDVGGFRKDYDGAQDYDFVFRCTEIAKEIYHIPKVLYHWRANSMSTAYDPSQKLYAFKAGEKAIKEHCKRIEIGRVEVESGAVLGTYRVRYPVKENPKVSVIIPSKDHVKDLDRCLTSLMEKETYKNIEVLVVENNSVEPETFRYYEKIQQLYKNVRVLEWKEEGFNFSKINNYAAGFAKGEYFLFLNNDTEFIAENCIEELLGICQKKDIGAVGAQLFYPDNTIQHAGVVIGYKGIAGHTFVGKHKGQKTYFMRSMCIQNYSAVTAACMMVKKVAFEAAGGFEERLAVAFNDIDFCLKLRKYGWLVAYNPFAQLYHYESRSRGMEDTPEKIVRFDNEVELFRKRWKDILQKGDPYYNPNLTLLKPDFSLRDLQKEPYV